MNMKKSINYSWSYLLLAFVVLAFGIATNGLTTIKIMNIVDAGMAQDLVSLKEQFIAIIVLVGLSLCFNMLASYTKGVYLYKSLVRGKNDYLERLFGKNINEFQAENNAKYLSAITNDMNAIEKKYLEGKYEVGDAIIGFLISFLVIASVSIYALLIGVAVSIICGGLSALASKPLQRHEKQRSDMFQGYTSYIKEVLGAFQIIKANDLEGKVKNDFFEKSNNIQQKGYLIDKIYTYIISAQNFFMYGANFGILIATTYMAIKGMLSVGAVILIINNMGRVIFPLMNMAEWLPKIFSVKSLFEKMDESLENNDNHQETLELTEFRGCIEFREVGFSYGEQEVLRGVNLCLNKGKKYLMVGPSGGGKSTLLKLLRKYFSPTQGRILLDGMELRDVKKNSYFSTIANVEQSVFLFEDTIRNNITLFKQYTEEEIASAIKRGGLSDFIARLPQGLETMIYDNGKNISGGEKSRIALARGLLAKADIIFLDEAFRSLDALVAKEIEKTLLALEDVTILNVSHVTFEDTKAEYDQILRVQDKTVLVS